MTTNVFKNYFFGGNIFIVPVLATIFIHGLLGLILTANWTLFSPEDWQIVSQPKVIEAHLVRIDNRNIPSPKKIEKIKRPAATPIRPRSTKKVEQLNAKAADCATEAIATDNSYFAGYVMRGRVLGQRGNILGAMNDFRIANEC